jgi:hypothetical protein
VAEGKALTTPIAVSAVIAGAAARRSMKLLKSTALAAVLTIGAVSGCGAGTSAKVPDAKDLIGTWAQTGAGFREGKPVTWETTVVVETVEGQGFTGFKEYDNEGEDPQKEVVNGAVGVNGDIRIADEDGLFVGRLVDGKIVGQHVEVSKGESQVLNVELVRK